MTNVIPSKDAEYSKGAIIRLHIRGRTKGAVSLPPTAYAVAYNSDGTRIVAEFSTKFCTKFVIKASHGLVSENQGRS